MGSAACKCLSNSAVQVEPTDMPQPSIVKQNNYVKLQPSLPNSIRTQPTTKNSHSLPTITITDDEHPMVPNRISLVDVRSMKKLCKQEPFQEFDDSVILKQSLYDTFTPYTKMMLKLELPNCVFFKQESPGQWFRNRDGACYFDDTMAETTKQTKVTTYFMADGRIYYGEISRKRKPHGIGLLIIPQPESIYKGDFREGEPEGIGWMQLNDVTIEGSWRKGQIYRGIIRNSKSQYEGEVKNGVPHGKGCFKDLAGRVIFRGHFLQGLLQRPFTYQKF